MISNDKYFERMIAAHPSFSQDLGSVAHVYNSLIKFGPKVMQDPLFAGAWVDHVIQSRDPAMNSYQGLIAAARAVAELESLLRRTLPEDELQFGRD